MKWFNGRLDTPAYQEMAQGPVPSSDRLCLLCDEPMLTGEPGVWMPTVGIEGKSDLEPEHAECHLRSVIGSPNHLTRTCSCYGGTGDYGRTYREQAKEAAAMWWGPTWREDMRDE